MIFQGGENETEIRKCALVANIQHKDLTLEEKGEGLIQYYKSGGVDPEHALTILIRYDRENKLKIKRNLD